MCAVPAQVAGVERIVVVTPPDGAGLVAAAAELLGIDEVWAVGGAAGDRSARVRHETIPRVDKIVGPGNAYVNEAKLLVSRDVAIDLPAGPSEVVVLAGRGADRADRRARARRAGASTAPTPSAALVDANGDLEAALAEVERRRARAPRPARRRRGARRRASATPARSSSAPTRRSPPATTRPAATTCCRPAAGRARSAGSGSRRS